MFRSSALAVRICVGAGGLFLTGCGDAPTAPPQAYSPSVIFRWDDAALEAVRRTRLGPPMVARALAVAHTAMYDAWAVYDSRAAPTRLDPKLRRPVNERTAQNKARAISQAAYRALSDLFPQEEPRFSEFMRELGYDQGDFSTNPATAVGIGNLAAEAVLAFRHHDGSNQLGDLAPGTYLDYTNYEPVNEANNLVDPNRWQPLVVPDQQGGITTQRFVAPHWGRVTPFAMTSGDQFRPATVPNLYPSAGYAQQVDEILELSANLTDRDKATVGYWSDGPSSELPPGHWILFSQFVSSRDEHTLDDDVKMMFAVTNAMFDASIAVWDCKRAFDYVRPITAVHFLMAGREIRAWAGPGKGTQIIRGEDWRPYQTLVVPTPPFPEFSSGHSAFSTAAAEVLKAFTGSDAFGGSATVKAGSSKVEPGIVPAADVVLSWATFSIAADEAGMSRRLGGIHFKEGDLQSRAMGRKVGAQAWAKALVYFNGTRGN
jgi:hypothetical protein